jgi:hypothetical protein
VAGKRLEILKEVAPDATPMAILFNPANATSALDVKAAEAAARTMGVTSYVLEVRAPGDFVNAFSSMTRERDGALLVSSDPVTYRHRQQIATLAAGSNIPAIYAHSDFAKVGGLMAYGADLDNLFARAGSYVGEILKGAKPADLPGSLHRLLGEIALGACPLYVGSTGEQRMADFAERHSLSVCEPRTPLQLCLQDPIFGNQVLVAQKQFLVHGPGDVG